MRRLRTPAAAITSASPTLATQTPTAPAAIWRRAISGHLWVLACGRSFLPAALMIGGHLLEIALEAVEVEQERGRGELVSVMAGRIARSPAPPDPGYDVGLMPGRPFLQIPGPTLVPERIVRAMSQSIIDHRGPIFAALVRECLDGLKSVFQTERGHILLFPGSGTGAWEVALVNTLSPGDRVLACVNGHFSAGFARVATAYGIECDRLEVPYGDGIAAAAVEARLRADAARQIRAVLVVHNETSTGVTSNVEAVRQAFNADRPRRSADRGHRQLARQHRLPHGRVGRGRHPDRTARRG